MNLVEQNDAFRSSLGNHPTLPGQIVATRAVLQKFGAAFAERVLSVVKQQVTSVSDVDGDETLEDASELRFFEVEAERLFWKIDYFETSACETTARNPSEPCYRILTIGLTSDW